MLILLTVCHTFYFFYLSSTDFQNFPGPVVFFQNFPVLKNAAIKFQDFPGFPGPVRTPIIVFLNYTCVVILLNVLPKSVNVSNLIKCSITWNLSAHGMWLKQIKAKLKFCCPLLHFNSLCPTHSQTIVLMFLYFFPFQ